LEVRCGGESHGGCQAGCLIFWKEAWLKRVVEYERAENSLAGIASAAPSACPEEGVWAGRKASPGGKEGAVRYICQATELPYFSTALSSWDVRQYLEDFTSGNAGLGRIFSGFVYVTYNGLANAGVGLGPLLRWAYDRCQRVFGGVPYPRRSGRIPAGTKTPIGELGLQPGEWVRVKTYDEILATIDTSNKNRGLYFDAEMVPYCGRTLRVLKRVNRIVNEQTGEIQEFKNPCIILDGAVCQSRYSECRLFCPRSIYTYWREIWLERVDGRPELPNEHQSKQSKVGADST
jgi:hypothetical protein